MTEIPGVCCNPFEGPDKPGSMGPVGRHPDPGRDRGRSAGSSTTTATRSAPDEVGEFWVKHPIVMQGYFRDPGADAGRRFATAGS